MQESLIPIGKVSRLHGFKGEVSLKLFEDYAQILQDLDHVFIMVNGKAVPFFFDSIRMTPQGFALVMFDGIDDEKGAELLRGKEILVTSSLVESDDPQGSHSLVGFKVVDVHQGDIGAVESVVEHTSTSWLRLNHEQGEILIPFHEDIVLEIDEKQKVISVDIPSGLFELNLK